MQNFSFVVALRIWHPSIDPEDISVALNLKPERQWKVGEARTTAKGRSLGGVQAETYWFTDPFNHGEYLSHQDQVEDVFFDVLRLLAPKKEFLNLLSTQGARAHLQVSTHSNRNYALVLPPELLHECSELGLSLVHDTYPYPQSW